MSVPLKDFLAQDNVLISDPDKLWKKINKIQSDTHAKLQIVTDFDHTLTRHDGLTTFDMFNKCPSVPGEYIKANEELKKEYGDIAKTANMTPEEKKKHYSEWFGKVYDKIKETVNKFPFNELAAQAKEVKFKTGVEVLIQKCKEQNVPILVFSAGMGECVNAIMKENNYLYSNINIIANFCEVNDDGKVLGVKGNFLIHSNNKNEAIHRYADDHFNKETNRRNNVLLFGDMTGDANMVNDHDYDVVIRVGFLYYNPEKNTDETEKNKKNYSSVFDIVLLNDNTVDLPNILLNLIIGSE
ncbi:7-methylguanosine phosphate-specific 5'-nucleotidase A-like [Achroia grisella]|uniref:7-methylguanosine phosphate-specific 5'-nucleotidase A-like n=1 Tax=Achroia grisella TaxID=688607 RepID=UPI0027D34DD4|nr:7-methylguanosine phosphate-specific 5'-nucleotidase A-like [Achroia grisella]